MTAAKQLKKLAATAAFAITAFTGATAQAGEGSFGWIYTLDLQPKGTWEFEQKAFLQRGQSQGTYDNWQFKSELEYGVSENYQIGLYANTSYVNAYRNGIDGETGGPGTDLRDGFDTSNRYKRFRFESFSFENIWRLTNPVTDPIGIGLYLEPEIGPRTKELEARLLLQKNFLDDRLVVASNITFATERERASGVTENASMLDTTLGFSYRFANNMSAGLEYRNHREFLGNWLESREHSAHFLGPNFHYAEKNWWVTVAWRHQMPWVKTYNQEQADVVVNGKIFGDEHARDEVMLKVGFPL
jgi:opacity protein-like surface antigen